MTTALANWDTMMDQEKTLMILIWTSFVVWSTETGMPEDLHILCFLPLRVSAATTYVEEALSGQLEGCRHGRMYHALWLQRWWEADVKRTKSLKASRTKFTAPRFMHLCLWAWRHWFHWDQVMVNSNRSHTLIMYRTRGKARLLPTENQQHLNACM